MTEKDKQFTDLCSDFLDALKKQKRHYVLLVSSSAGPEYTRGLGAQALYGDSEIITYLLLEAMLDVTKSRDRIKNTIGEVQ